MIINPIFDTSDPSFIADIQAAINQYAAAFPLVNVTVNIRVGDGDFDGIRLNNQNESLGDINGNGSLSYTSLSAHLRAANPVFFNSANLPAGSSINGQSSFIVSTTQERLFGLLPAAARPGDVDGIIGIGTGFTPGTVRIAGALHEIGHALGRVPGSELDLFRFISPGVHLFGDGATPVPAAYFSTDGGVTRLANWGVDSDPSDFLNDALTPNDPYNEFVGNFGQLTALDDVTMNALGFPTALPAMTVDLFHATESTTGDTYYGEVYDDTGRYSVGSTLTFPGDQAGGRWTYTVDSIATADAAHQGAAYSGKVYDYYYVDADLGAAAYPTKGTAGFTGGVAKDTTSFSGSGYLGSDSDTVTLQGQSSAFGSGFFVVADLPVMKADYFHATESATGDTYYGVVYDNTGRYFAGSTLTLGLDDAGGHWTYTVDSTSTADAAHQNASYSGKVYDYYYIDPDRAATAYPTKGMAGFSGGTAQDTTSFSGSSYLGSDGDTVTLQGVTAAFGNGTHVVPEAMKADYFHATESATGDSYYGVVYDNTGRYSVGSTLTLGTIDQAGGHWTYTVDSVLLADSAHQGAVYNGKIYDYLYVDANIGAAASPFYGYQGYVGGPAKDTSFYSGSNYFGSDADQVAVMGSSYQFGTNGFHVVPEMPLMKVANFHATESVTGDTYSGLTYDNTGRYSVGSTVTLGTDDAGGHWTYVVDSIATAAAAHQNPSYSGMVYDSSYSDPGAGSFAPFYGSQGINGGPAADMTFFSGSGGLGSDGDVVTINGFSYAVASGVHVVPDPLPSHTIVAGPTTLAATGGGSALGGSDGTTSANLGLLGNLGAAAFASTGNDQPAAPLADPVTPATLLAQS